MLVLPPNYRFTVKNETGQTLANNSCRVDAKRYNFNSTGALNYESSETNVYLNSGTISNGAYNSGSSVDNTSDKYIGGIFEITVTAPASANGNVILYLDRSTDAGSSYDDNGLGDIVAVFNFTASGTQKKTISL